MCDAAWQWASPLGFLRINSVHKEEEARLILSDEFELLDETGQEIQMGGNIEVDETCPFVSA